MTNVEIMTTIVVIDDRWAGTGAELGYVRLNGLVVAYVPGMEQTNDATRTLPVVLHVEPVVVG
jgi:hypothetical protein